MYKYVPLMTMNMGEVEWCAMFLVMFSIATISLSKETLGSDVAAQSSSVTFLINVNNTYKHIPPFDNTTYTCTTTTKTNPLYPNTPSNKTEKIMMGNCDNGTLVFDIRSDVGGNTSLMVTYSSIFIATSFQHTCTIDWNLRYRLPSQAMGTAEESLLPGCYTTNTFGPEGIEVVSYWFYILDWDVSSKDLKQQYQDPGVNKDPKITSVTFLVAVNSTETKCLTTSKTPALKPGVVHNNTEYIYVGNCDYGALDFNITTSKDDKGNVHSSIYMVFHSHDIEDASPPTCTIPWDYSYKIPSDTNYQSSLLPGCYVEDSREGFHMTYYWFYVMDWEYE